MLLRWIRVLASVFLQLKVSCSHAALWAFGGAAFLLGCGFWFSAADTFRLWCGVSGRAAAVAPAS
jgi:hypothetical protein